MNSKSVLYSLGGGGGGGGGGDGTAKWDIFSEVKYLIHCIMSRGIGIEFCWVPPLCSLYWNDR